MPYLVVRRLWLIDAAFLVRKQVIVDFCFRLAVAVCDGAKAITRTEVPETVAGMFG